MPAPDIRPEIRAEARAQALDVKEGRDPVPGMHARYDVAAAELDARLEGQGVRLACAKGCAACCHSLVGLLPAEAVSLARHIDALPDAAALKARILAHHAEHGRKSGRARMRERIACPCLDPVTRLCAVHPARPLTCRAMNAVDAAPCRAALERGDPDLPIPSVLPRHAALQTIYDAHGLVARRLCIDPGAVELSGALAALWEGQGSFDNCRVRDITEDAVPRF